MTETTRFHPARWTRMPASSVGGSGYLKVCYICGKRIGETITKIMLNEIVLIADPEGCCEVRPEPKTE
jgi:hypothetical protein